MNLFKRIIENQRLKEIKDMMDSNNNSLYKESFYLSERLYDLKITGKRLLVHECLYDMFKILSEHEDKEDFLNILCLYEINKEKVIITILSNLCLFDLVSIHNKEIAEIAIKEFFEKHLDKYKKA